LKPKNVFRNEDKQTKPRERLPKGTISENLSNPVISVCNEDAVLFDIKKMDQSSLKIIGVCVWRVDGFTRPLNS
jgi:hypothetical protein